MEQSLDKICTRCIRGIRYFQSLLEKNDKNEAYKVAEALVQDLNKLLKED